MKKSMVAIAMVLAAMGASAQSIVSSESMTVTDADCIKTERDSLVGAGIGGVAGAATGRLLGGLLSRSGGTIGTLAGAGVGALVGNEMAKETVYTCELVLTGVDKRGMIHTHTSEKKILIGSPVIVHKLENGRLVMKTH